MERREKSVETRGVSVPPSSTGVEEPTKEKKAAGVSGYTGFSEIKYKGEFAK